jgi:hypothetical protein
VGSGLGFTLGWTCSGPGSVAAAQADVFSDFSNKLLKKNLKIFMWIDHLPSLSALSQHFLIRSAIPDLFDNL